MTGKSAMLFVDAQNLWYGANAFDESFHYDPVKLKDVLAEGYDLIRAYWFDSYPQEENTKRGFFHFLETNGFRVDAKPLRKREDGPVEKGADVGLASELIALGYEEAYDCHPGHGRRRLHTSSQVRSGQGKTGRRSLV